MTALAMAGKMPPRPSSPLSRGSMKSSAFWVALARPALGKPGSAARGHISPEMGLSAFQEALDRLTKIEVLDRVALESTMTRGRFDLVSSCSKLLN